MVVFVVPLRHDTRLQGGRYGKFWPVYTLVSASRQPDNPVLHTQKRIKTMAVQAVTTQGMHYAQAYCYIVGRQRSAGWMHGSIYRSPGGHQLQGYRAK